MHKQHKKDREGVCVGESKREREQDRQRSGDRKQRTFLNGVKQYHLIINTIQLLEPFGAGGGGSCFIVDFCFLFLSFFLVCLLVVCLFAFVFVLCLFVCTFVSFFGYLTSHQQTNVWVRERFCVILPH